MRVTQNMLNNNMLNNLRQNSAEMQRSMEQLSTGKKINRPSDDPVVAMKGVDYRSELSKVEQFERNMSEVRSWMDTSDEAMNEAGQSLQRIRELVVQASNDTYDGDDRANMASEVEEIKNHLTELANSRVNNKYIFNGANTLEPRFDIDEEGNRTSENANDDAVEIEVSDGVYIQSNINPENAFSDEMFNSLDEVVDALRGGDLEEGEDGAEVRVSQFLDELDDHNQNLVNERADLGARMNRADLIENRLSQQKVTTNQLKSNNEDADMSEVIMNLQMQENVHRASLGAGARVLQPTLMDFLN
ncbi:flagellar hook-associated protein 3 FlgL [Alkalibacillus filiformis]|uniref:Flagellar hook-associated protein 3 FlgL n=1 Tax=Alkalibacillus filiformis TaxID=200990 RepID=A0ABU0DXA2_9BACI|nr:flagellar hook-associated protein FlgL [Alkalibacillus filiformis]MDQ0352901.1 flagellar hook-associated protein 3 FlgL [Alkalibacillus filiformis]